MITVVLLNNKTQKRFQKVFYSDKQFRNFKRKVEKGSALKVLCIRYEED